MHPSPNLFQHTQLLDQWLAVTGLRSLGPVWSLSNAFGHGVPFLCPSSPDTGPGLTDVGKELTRACNRLRILIDLSHLNERGFWDVAAISKAPLVATHSNAHALSPHSRNLTDKQLTAIGETGGMVGVNFATSYLRPGSANVGRRNSFVIRGASTYGFGVKLGRPPGAGRPPGSRNKKTLAREILHEAAAKTGVDPKVFMYERMAELIARGDDKSNKEAVAIACELLPYLYPRLSTTSVNAQVEQRSIIRVPEKSSSIDAWMETYGPMLGALPTTKTEEPN
jgi:microsomal dipeptidase-like Zn-dependent dipeptidase